VFNIGDRAMSKQTGCPTVGTVKGIMEARFYHEAGQKPLYKNWYDLYPDYLEKNVIFLRFDQPQKALSFEEFKQYNAEQISKDYVTPEEQEQALKAAYEVLQPTISASYPEDDLELL
jgi:hypothetical protein